MDAFDADVLIYAAAPGHPLGERVAALFPATAAPRLADKVGIGSALLVPEVLSKPLRVGDAAAVTRVSQFLVRLDLRPVDGFIAAQAAVLGARYKLGLADATHLATAIRMGAPVHHQQQQGLRQIDQGDRGHLPRRPGRPG
jgi:predicted nucleic acid-binding protein